MPPGKPNIGRVRPKTKSPIFLVFGIKIYAANKGIKQAAFPILIVMVDVEVNETIMKVPIMSSNPRNSVSNGFKLIANGILLKHSEL